MGRVKKQYRHCCVNGCRFKKGWIGRADDDQPIKLCFHEFPSNYIIRAKWLRKVFNVDDCKISDRTLVCGLHFATDDYKLHNLDGRPTQRKCLKSTAVPSLHLQRTDDIIGSNNDD